MHDAQKADLSGSPVKEVVPKRLASLDSLRAVAILLVLGAHMSNVPVNEIRLNAVFRFWRQGGWVGVDLFFVLSGFLIGGLLFREFQKYGTISFRRFFVRRGLKIYPPFFVLLATTLVVRACLAEQVEWHSIIGELLFLQNYYVGKLWLHTWSLAVEEHFYLLLPLILFLLIRRNPNTTNPFLRIPRLFLILALGLLCLRVLNACYYGNDFTFPRCLQRTHLRIDSLMFGVLGAYFFYFRHDAFVNFVLPKRRLLAGLGIGLILPAFCFPMPSTPFIYTLGFTLFYLGSGLLLAAMVVGEGRPGPVLRVVAFIGAYSYSIYLWHVPFKDWICPRLAQFFGFESYALCQGIYVCGSIIFGIVMGKVIEYPVLHLRDRVFPSRIGSDALESSNAEAAKRRLTEATPA